MTRSTPSKARPERAPRPHRDEEVEPEHRRRQDERERHDRLDEELPPARERREPPGERQPDRRGGRPSSAPTSRRERRMASRSTVSAPAGVKPKRDEDGAARRVRRESRGRPGRPPGPSRRLQDDARLPDRRVEPSGELSTQRPAARIGGARASDSATRPASAAPDSDELRRLGDVLAEDELLLHRVPDAERLQRRLGRAAVRRVPRVGDGDLLHGRIGEGEQAAPARGRAASPFRTQSDEPPHRRRGTPSPRLRGPPRASFAGIVGVGREEEVEGRAVRDLREEAPRRTVRHPHLDVRAHFAELLDGGVERELQVGGRGNPDFRTPGRGPGKERREDGDSASERPESSPFLQSRSRLSASIRTRFPPAAGRLGSSTHCFPAAALPRFKRSGRLPRRGCSVASAETALSEAAGDDPRNRHRPPRRRPDGDGAGEGRGRLPGRRLHPVRDRLLRGEVPPRPALRGAIRRQGSALQGPRGPGPGRLSSRRRGRARPPARRASSSAAP